MTESGFFLGAYGAVAAAKQDDEWQFVQLFFANQEKAKKLGADEIALRPVGEYHELESAQQGQALGDTLPIGLRLITDLSP